MLPISDSRNVIHFIDFKLFIFSWFLFKICEAYGVVLLEKLIVAQLVKKFLAFYGTERFITMFTGACH
jgi:hypothetical protein